jgi:hypothetical protein
MWLLLVVVNDVIVAHPPDHHAAVGEFSEWAATQDEPAKLALMTLEMAAFGFGFLFLGIIAVALRSATPGRDVLRFAAIIGGLVAMTVKLGSAMPIIAIRLRAGDGLDPLLIRTLVDLNEAGFIVTFVPYAVLALALGVLIIRSRLLPVWIGWWGVATGVALVIGAPFALDEGPGFLAMLSNMLWMSALSIALFVRWPTLFPASAEDAPSGAVLAGTRATAT